jgi:hypothetical protein
LRHTVARQPTALEDRMLSMPTPARTRSIARLATASVAVLALGAALVGCGSSSGGDSKDSSSKSLKLSKADATAALLTQENLGTAFKPDTSADNTTASPGCLTAVDAITDKNDAPIHVKTDFQTDDEDSFPLVGNQVASYDSVADAKAAVTKLRDALASCTSVDDSAGKDPSSDVITKLTVGTSAEKASAKDDDELNIKAVGQISGSGGNYPIGLYLAVVRIKNNLSITSVGALSKDAPAGAENYVVIAQGRLAAVINGDDPDKVTAE